MKLGIYTVSIILTLHCYQQNVQSLTFIQPTYSSVPRIHNPILPIYSSFSSSRHSTPRNLLKERILNRSQRRGLSQSDNDHPSTASSASSNDSDPKVLCIGETLWDCLPNGMFLGGAPTNVAIHLSSLSNTPTAIISCLGNDELGDETIERLQSQGVNTKYVQRQDMYTTGKVIAQIDPKTGDATYEFDTPSAWDFLNLSSENNDIDDSYQKEFMEIYNKADVVVMGSICGRLDPTKDEYDNATSANTLFWVRRSCKKDTLIFDVNLRPPWYTPEFILMLARGGQTIDEYHPNPLALLKVNEEELDVLEGWCNAKMNENRSLEGEGLCQRMKNLAQQLNAKRICVTRGEDGAALWSAPTSSSSCAVFVEHPGFQNKEETDEKESDTVGAGDAFLAALIRSLFLERESPEQALMRGCALGGFVASCQGATPLHEDAPLHFKNVFSFQ